MIQTLLVLFQRSEQSTRAEILSDFFFKSVFLLNSYVCVCGRVTAILLSCRTSLQDDESTGHGRIVLGARS
jgi:hypothetical protein